jgi:hypothetical protein
MPEPTPDFQPMWEDMAKTVAQATTSWSRVENAMATLLEKLIGYSTDNIGTHIYFAPNNTETRFKIVDTLARVKMGAKEVPHDLISEWNSVFVALGKAKETRNRIAHGEIQTPGLKKKGKWAHQARLTASSYDIGRTWKEHKPRQWPGMSINDVRATADKFYWLAVRIEEIAQYWQTYSLHWKLPPLPEIFARIVERRRNSGPLSSDLKPPKPNSRPPSSLASRSKGPKLSSKQRRLRALAAREKT